MQIALKLLETVCISNERDLLTDHEDKYINIELKLLLKNINKANKKLK